MYVSNRLLVYLNNIVILGFSSTMKDNFAPHSGLSPCFRVTKD